MRLLSQTPIEEIDETRCKADCLDFLVALCMQIKKRFPLEEGVVARFGILDPAAAQELTKCHSSIANVTLHFPHL